MSVMLFRKHVGGRTYYAEGFSTLEEAQRVARRFEENDRLYPSANGRRSETIIEECGGTIKDQLKSAIHGPTDRLRHHVTGAIERGEAVAIVGIDHATEESGFRTELTPAGEQTVIPGCERDNEQTGPGQLSLF